MLFLSIIGADAWSPFGICGLANIAAPCIVELYNYLLSIRFCLHSPRFLFFLLNGFDLLDYFRRLPGFVEYRGCLWLCQHNESVILLGVRLGEGSLQVEQAAAHGGRRSSLYGDKEATLRHLVRSGRIRSTVGVVGCSKEVERSKDGQGRQGVRARSLLTDSPGSTNLSTLFEGATASAMERQWTGMSYFKSELSIRLYAVHSCARTGLVEGIAGCPMVGGSGRLSTARSRPTRLADG